MKQAILERILFYRSSKCKQTKEQGSENCLWTQLFTFLWDYCHFFSSKDTHKTGSKCTTIGGNLPKKHKVTLYKTERRTKLPKS